MLSRPTNRTGIFLSRHALTAHIYHCLLLLGPPPRYPVQPADMATLNVGHREADEALLRLLPLPPANQCPCLAVWHAGILFHLLLAAMFLLLFFSTVPPPPTHLLTRCAARRVSSATVLRSISPVAAFIVGHYNSIMAVKQFYFWLFVGPRLV